LAIDQATAYITASGRTIEDYRELLVSSRAELLARGAAGGDYPETVATTWNVALKEVANMAPAAIELLNLVAFLAPDGIPRNVFNNVPENVALPKQLAAAVEAPLAFDDLVMALRQYSLVDAEADTIAVNRLVQDVTRDRIDQPATCVEAAVGLVAGVFSFDPGDPGGPGSWRAAAVMLPHAAIVLAHADTYGVADADVRALHATVGRYLQTTGQYAPARDHFARALSIDEATLGPDHPDTLDTRLDIAALTGCAGHPDEARRLSDELLPDRERVLGSDHPGTLRTRSSLAFWAGEAGHSDEALRLLEGLLPNQERVLGSDHPDTLSTASVIWMMRGAGESE